MASGNHRIDSVELGTAKRSNPLVSATVGGIKIEDTTVVLPKQKWDIVVRQGQIEQVKPIPHSWFNIQEVASSHLAVPNVLALLCCPKCKDVNAVAWQINTINSLGKICPRFICGYHSCRYSCEIYLDEYHKKTLYALALEDGKKIELRYTHADNAREASLGVDLRKWRVIGIGPAIGYHVEDKQGMVLSV
jgi:hypothetical protein